jgi:AcrR family transcriptional regulator
MDYKKRARSKAAKSDRKEAITASAEALLRQLGYDAMTMQAVATEAGLAKGTLYLYFSSREGLILDVYGRLFDTWIDQFASHVSEATGVGEFCRIFCYHYKRDPLFVKLIGFATSYTEPQLDRESYIRGKRAMASRVKKLAGIACQRLEMTPVLAQRFVWGLLTVASGATQMSMPPSQLSGDFPADVTTFIGSTNFETVFLNAAVPLCTGMIQADT